MFNITANEARAFQKAGISQEEALSEALFRCHKAVIEQSKRGKSSVEVAVFDLDDKSFDTLQTYILKHSFKLWNVGRHNDRTHTLTIVWE